MSKYLKLFKNQTEYNNSSEKGLFNHIIDDASLKYNQCSNNEFVDLGLSVKWAKMNIGASTETDYGLYFQWGDVSGYTANQVDSDDWKNKFTWLDYEYNGGEVNMIKYNLIDSKTLLDTSDDAAVINMGGSWRMPTETEFNELLNANTIYKQWVSINGVNGYKFYVIADPSKYVFFPAGGSYQNGSGIFVGSSGLYWSNTLSTSDVTRAVGFDFHSSRCAIDNYVRYTGCLVRGVIN